MTYVEHDLVLERCSTFITDYFCISVFAFNVLAYVRESITVEVTDSALVVPLALVPGTCIVNNNSAVYCIVCAVNVM